MQSKQATHTMPVTKHTPPLIISGMERSVVNSIGDTFAYKARTDGTVTKINEKDQTVEIQYTDGTKAYMSLSGRTVKNSGGGFFITTQLTLTNSIKVGSKFKKDDVLAYDKSFFAESANGDILYMSGLLVRTALCALDQTFEDSVMATSRLIKDTVSEVTMMIPVSLAAKTNLQYTVKLGDKVNPNSPLAIFETIVEDTDIADLLERIGDEFQEEIIENSRNTAVAKYSGTIVETRIYYNRPLEELSPTIRAFITKEIKISEEKKKRNTGSLPQESVRIYLPEYTTRGKVHGEEFDGILILFFIKTVNESAPGDKYVCQSPLKGIISKVLEEGEEPFDESGNIIDYIISPLSNISRMTSDMFLQLWGNSLLVGLKKEIIRIADE